MKPVGAYSASIQVYKAEDVALPPDASAKPGAAPDIFWRGAGAAREQRAEILRPTETTRATLAASKDAFVAYIREAASANAAFLEVTPEARKAGYAEVGRFSTRTANFLEDAVALARQLFPDRQTRQSAFSAIDQVATELYAKNEGTGWHGSRCHWPVSPAMLAMTGNLMQALSEPSPWAGRCDDRALENYIFPTGPKDFGFAGQRYDRDDDGVVDSVWNPPASKISYGVLLADGKATEVHADTKIDLTKAGLTATASRSSIDERSGETRFDFRAVTIDKDAKEPVMVMSRTMGLYGTKGGRVDETWVDMQKAEIRHVTAEYRPNAGRYERSVTEERATRFDPKNTNVVELGLVEDFAWRPDTHATLGFWNDKLTVNPSPEKLLFFELCHGLDNLGALEKKK